MSELTPTSEREMPPSDIRQSKGSRRRRHKRFPVPAPIVFWSFAVLTVLANWNFYFTRHIGYAVFALVNVLLIAGLLILQDRTKLFRESRRAKTGMHRKHFTTTELVALFFFMLINLYCVLFTLGMIGYFRLNM